MISPVCSNHSVLFLFCADRSSHITQRWDEPASRDRGLGGCTGSGGSPSPGTRAANEGEARIIWVSFGDAKYEMNYQ